MNRYTKLCLLVTLWSLLHKPMCRPISSETSKLGNFSNKRLLRRVISRSDDSDSSPPLQSQSLAAKVGTVLDHADSIVSVAVALKGSVALLSNPYVLAAVVVTTVVAAGAYKLYHWHKRRQLPPEYSSQVIVPIQVGTGKPLWTVTRGRVTQLGYPTLPPAIAQNTKSTQTKFWLFLLSLLTLNLFLALLYLITYRRTKKSASAVYRKKSRHGTSHTANITTKKKKNRRSRRKHNLYKIK